MWEHIFCIIGIWLSTAKSISRRCVCLSNVAKRIASHTVRCWVVLVMFYIFLSHSDEKSHQKWLFGEVSMAEGRFGAVKGNGLGLGKMSNSLFLAFISTDATNFLSLRNLGCMSWQCRIITETTNLLTILSLLFTKNSRYCQKRSECFLTNEIVIVASRFF